MKKVFMVLLGGVLISTASNAQSLLDQAKASATDAANSATAKAKASANDAKAKATTDLNKAKASGKQAVTDVSTTAAKVKSKQLTTKEGIAEAKQKVTADANQAKSVGKQTVESAKTAVKTGAAKLKKDGTPDMRFKDNKAKLKLKADSTIKKVKSDIKAKM